MNTHSRSDLDEQRDVLHAFQQSANSLLRMIERNGPDLGPPEIACLLAVALGNYTGAHPKLRLEDSLNVARVVHILECARQAKKDLARRSDPRRSDQD